MKDYQPLKISVKHYNALDIVRTSNTPQDLEEIQTDFFFDSSNS